MEREDSRMVEVAYAPSAPTGEDTTYGDIAPGISKMGLVSVSLKPGVVLPEHINWPALKGYFHKILLDRRCSGHFHIWKFEEYPRVNPFIYTFKFDRGDHCALHGPGCDYGFDYKIKRGYYGGWKCWKTGDWESQFIMPEVFQYGPK